MSGLEHCIRSRLRLKASAPTAWLIDTKWKWRAVKLGKCNAKAPSTLPPSHRQTNSSLGFFPTTHTSTLQAIHLSMPSSSKPYAIAPTPLHLTTPTHFTSAACLTAPLSLQTQSCTHIGDPPQKALFSKFSAHDSLGDTAIKTDGIRVVQDLLNLSAAETKTWCR